MYKSKLQELCQRRSWELPQYATAKDGPDHIPRFTAAVAVHGELFETPAHCKSSKEAQNAAARVAFEHLTAPPSATSCDPSQPLPGCPDTPFPVVPPPQIQPLAVAADPALPPSPLPSSLPNPPPDILHVYKNLLQQHAQKENMGFPVYTFEAEGPPHAWRFKSKVSLNGKSYETLEFFTTLKEAEQAAAKIAYQAVSVDFIQEGKGIYKNLLQELTQKKFLMYPSYVTVRSGVPHNPIFVSTVEIGSDSFRGSEAGTRKQAEMNAAKVGYYALTKGGPPTNSINISAMNRYPFADDLSQNNIQPTATTEKHLDIQPTATSKKHQVTTYEDGQLNAKRAKSLSDQHRP